jgi:L-ornithine Nalpha-acyltransferase
MNVTLRRGRFAARLAATPADLDAAQRLRHLCFVTGAGLPPRPKERDGDAFDARCLHVLIEEVTNGQLACCLRLMLFATGAELAQGYAAQFYDLSGLSRLSRPLAEVGRFCIHPGQRDGDALRMAWGAIAGIVDRSGVELLFGCCSFAGTDPARYQAAFAALHAGHLAPADWRPGVRAPEIVALGPPAAPPDRFAALREMPPLLCSYLGLGGRVSDHAVVDRDMNTLHVLTGVEIAAIPPARARALRQVAAIAQF